MVDVQGGDLSACESIAPNSQFWPSYYLIKKHTKLCIMLPTCDLIMVKEMLEIYKAHMLLLLPPEYSEINVIKMIQMYF